MSICSESWLSFVAFGRNSVRRHRQRPNSEATPEELLKSLAVRVMVPFAGQGVAEEVKTRYVCIASIDGWKRRRVTSGGQSKSRCHRFAICLEVKRFLIFRKQLTLNYSQFKPLIGTKAQTS